MVVKRNERIYKLEFFDVSPAEIRGNTKAHWRTMRRINREIDLDNLIEGMNSTLDGIVDSGILIDDKPSNMELRVKFTKSDKQNIKTLVYIKEIE